MEWNLLYDWQQLDKEEKELTNSKKQQKNKRMLKLLQQNFGEEKELLKHILEKINMLESAQKKIGQDYEEELTEKEKQQQQLYSGNIINPKELQAMEQHIAFREEKIRQLATEQEELSQEMITLQKQGICYKKKLKAIQSEFETLKEEIIAMQEENKEKINSLEKEKNILWQKISPEGQAWFLKHSSRFSAPIGILRKGSYCQDCGMMLPPAMIKQIKAAPATVRCEKCGKYLIEYQPAEK